MGNVIDTAQDTTLCTPRWRHAEWIAAELDANTLDVAYAQYRGRIAEGPDHELSAEFMALSRAFNRFWYRVDYLAPGDAL